MPIVMLPPVAVGVALERGVGEAGPVGVAESQAESSIMLAAMIESAPMRVRFSMVYVDTRLPLLPT